jgi:hypothetical protein
MAALPPARPFLAVYVVWHTHFAGGAELANALYNHYRRDLYENVAGGTGLCVLFRFTPVPGSNVPLGIDYDAADTSAVVALLDDRLASDKDWKRYVTELADRAESAGLRARVFPVAMTEPAMRAAALAPQSVRWYSWDDLGPKERERRLISELTLQFCRMLRHYLEHLKRPAEPEEALERFLEKVRVFLSHSKHDEHRGGEKIALAIRDTIHSKTGLDSFFDVRDIPAGLHFAKVLEHYVRVSAVVAIHTDSYSSREWCRREITEAKRHNVPLVVANCLTDFEERGFPYMGNVPVVRMEPGAKDRVWYVIGRLLDEVLKDFLWRCRVEASKARKGAKRIVFLARPPELISLVSLLPVGKRRLRQTVVYPDPPLGSEERSLFHAVAPTVSLRSYTEWLAEPDEATDA